MARPPARHGTDVYGLSGWEHLINAIRERATATPGLTLVLDEFPHLCESNPGLPFVLQKICDEVSPEGIPFNLMLCGSRIISFFLKAEGQELDPDVRFIFPAMASRL
jgi:hypothetical protein